MKNYLFVTVFAISCCSFTNLTAQFWLGVSNSTGIISRTGNVGVGLASPPNDTKLYVASNLKVGIVSETDHSGDYQFGIISAVTNPTTKAFSVLLSEDGGDFEDKFAVMGDGTLLTEQILVQVPVFPDYVFEPNYELKPLSEIETFISNNKHLPNIPPAKEIVKSGLNLGNIQVKQMEKIEELFLYIIQLEKRIGELEDQLSQE